MKLADRVFWKVARGVDSGWPAAPIVGNKSGGDVVRLPASAMFHSASTSRFQALHPQAAQVTCKFTAVSDSSLLSLAVVL